MNKLNLELLILISCSVTTEKHYEYLLLSCHRYSNYSCMLLCYVQFTNKDELYAQLVNCDVVIYDITQHADQIEEAIWVASRMLQ